MIQKMVWGPNISSVGQCKSKTGFVRSRTRGIWIVG